VKAQAIGKNHGPLHMKMCRHLHFPVFVFASALISLHFALLSLFVKNRRQTTNKLERGACRKQKQ